MNNVVRIDELFTDFDDGDPPEFIELICPDCESSAFSVYAQGEDKLTLSLLCHDCGCEIDGVYVESS